MTKEQIAEKFKEAMILNNLAFVLAEAANTFFLDMSAKFAELGLGFKHEDKHNFSEMRKYAEKAKYYSAKIAKSLYNLEDADDALYDADWFYLFTKLIHDRLGTDNRKTHMLIEFLDTMPSEGLFKVGLEDFQKL